MIRSATPDDIPAIVEMGRRFYCKAGLPGEYSDQAMAHFVDGLIRHGVVLIGARSMLGGVIAPVYCAPDWWQAVEMFWWSEDRRGIDLLAAFEAWARERGANEVRMSSVQASRGEAVGRVLARLGYETAETSYSKRVA